ncbi:MAG: response regulator transcription factor [Oscillochloris sp.]|nr:response regulator transcription factor [Oscillochloris sp.]
MSQEILTKSLHYAGYLPLCTDSGVAAIQLFRAHSPALVILDLMLPDIDGLMVCQAMRAESEVPILVLSALSSEERQVALFAAGADDYVIKPARRDELLARIHRALVRSQTPIATEPTSDYMHGIQMDEVYHDMWHETKHIHLTPTEWALLHGLLQAQTQVCTYQQLGACLWPHATQLRVTMIDMIATQLQQKLGTLADIIAVPGVGYRLHPMTEKPS